MVQTEFIVTKLKILLVALAVQCALIVPASADHWSSVVLSHCYAFDDRVYDRHFFVRVFLTETGGGQFFAKEQSDQKPRSLRGLNERPAACSIAGKDVRFETMDYSPPKLRGLCAQCDQTGFRLLVDGKVVWKVETPTVRGDPIFNGTIDVDRDMVRVCREHAPDTVGVELPHENHHPDSRTSVLICSTTSMPR